MTRDELIEELKKHRDNDVRVRVKMGELPVPVTKILYNTRQDVIILDVETPYSIAVVEDLVVLLAELDRGLARHDVGHSVWYEDWRKRVEEAVGCDTDELNTSKP